MKNYKPVHKIKKPIKIDYQISFFILLITFLTLLTLAIISQNTKIDNLILKAQQIESEQSDIIEVIKLEDKDIKEARITCYKETGNPTASGKTPKNGMVATSDRTIPFGTKVYIEGNIFTVEDRTASWVHTERGFTIDIFMEEGCDNNFGDDKKLIIIK